MTITGTTSFTQTQYQLVQNAFNLLNVYGIGRTFSNEDYTLATQMLNLMIKAWGAQGLHLWCKEEGILYLTQYKSKYGFGNSASIGLTAAYATLASGATTTQTTATAALGATTLNVLSTTGWAAGYYVGVVQSDNSLFWTTIASVVNSTSITLTLGTTQTVNAQSNVYVFSVLLNKPYRIISARMMHGFDSGATTTINETMMNPLSHADYYDLPTKSVNGLANQYYYDPHTDYGVLSLWPRPNDCSYRIHFTYERIISDITNPSDTFDFPAEWLEPLTWQLALRLIPAFGKEKKYPIIHTMASQMLENLLVWDSECTGVSFQPDRDGGGIY
jgi:hypothetical protein